jgi:hypothetical protein
VAAAVTVPAASVAGVAFDPAVRAAELTLPLRGAAMYRHLGVFKVYAAALYLPADADAAAMGDHIPRHLEIAYLRPLTAEDLVRSGDTFLRRNATAAEYARIREDLARINAWYEDVDAGDRYALAYMPGEGTTLLRNGIVQGAIPGAEFARIYFRIWLGDDPVSATVRDSLLGRR